MTSSCWSWLLSAWRKSLMSLSYDQLVWWPGHELEGPLVQDQPHGDLQTELYALQRELGAGNWSSWGGHHDVTAACWTPLQNPQTPQKLEPLGWWSTSLGEVSCAHPWEKALQSLKPPSNPPEMRRWRTSWPTPRCPNIHDETSGMKMGSCCQWSHGHPVA